MRFNVGVRTLDAGAKVTIRVRNAVGTVILDAQAAYPPNYFGQAAAAADLGIVLTGDESITYTVVEGAAIIYGTWTDNVTQDPGLHFATPR